MSENKTNDCGCEEELSIMHLVLDDDTELDCHVLGIFEVKDKEYIALVPQDEEEVLLYEYKETEDGVELDNIEDDEYELVAQAFDEIFEEGFEDEGCGCGEGCDCNH
ncbi:UPF0473 family protein [Gottschalkia acidurici 9a]|uniref:UPF0473 family protein n=1 Tax=Gottschalkia acidurici (strain ATCC 7906 / DSM 604 / BCRC 14475 / CIP 104303 / KCTC 5404 / NCIMB 10678 / 9a) TaxID=1128398 RepID=K0B1D0_GOTA9|nr:DUF1292 domain-containing protein [Gottschalkia acidurici]AFS78770.1 UPF0473 family protein [Gottschalkia acidurici 9a]